MCRLVTFVWCVSACVLTEGDESEKKTDESATSDAKKAKLDETSTAGTKEDVAASTAPVASGESAVTVTPAADPAATKKAEDEVKMEDVTEKVNNRATSV